MVKPTFKKNLADMVCKRKTSPAIKNNPFEVKRNRKKFDILGRKSKHDVGLPGVSRTKANDLRVQTLMKAQKFKHKSNTFLDKRFGEYNNKMAPEDKILKRFAMERQQIHEKKDMYNLNKDEDLTHYGQSLAEIENDTIVLSDDEYEEKGHLSAEHTASHFGGGGGLLRKKAPGEQVEGGEEEEQKPKTKMQFIEEFVQMSTRQTMERLTGKEEVLQVTEKLDQEWKSVQDMMVKRRLAAKNDTKPDKKSKPDRYDMLVQELRFDMKAQPSDKLKTADEVAREQMETMQENKAARLRRMKGEETEAQSQTHRSADDLNDYFTVNELGKKILAYQNGKWNLPEESVEIGGEEKAESGQKVREESDGESSKEDVASDLDTEEECDSEEDRCFPRLKNFSQEQKKKQQKKDTMSCIVVPTSYEDLTELLRGHTPLQQHALISSIFTRYRLNCVGDNKNNLENLFDYILKYIGEVATGAEGGLDLVNYLIPELFSQCKMFPKAASRSVAKVLALAAQHLEERVLAKAPLSFPSLDMMVYLKLIAVLYPTSDLRHPIVIPALLYISQTLTKCSVKSLRDLTCGLVLCCLALDYMSLCQRYMPEVVHFLTGTLHLAVDKSSSWGYKLLRPFHRSGPSSKLLVLSSLDSTRSWKNDKLLLSSTVRIPMKSAQELDHYRLSCWSTCLNLIEKCILYYKNHQCFKDIVGPLRAVVLHQLSAPSTPEVLHVLLRSIISTTDGCVEVKSPLVFQRRKPVPLKMLTPKIIEVSDNGKKRGSTRQEKESMRLLHKHKREMRATVREVRTHSRFLAKTKQDETLMKDAQRKKKVKELIDSLATQEGEFKVLKKKRRK